MAVRAEYVAELALIDLEFAQAEIRTSRNTSPEIVRALRHIEEAMEHLRRLVPGYDDTTPAKDANGDEDA